MALVYSLIRRMVIGAFLISTGIGDPGAD
jgi:hypothetical protein